jgi:hypothetical protein
MKPVNVLGLATGGRQIEQSSSLLVHGTRSSSVLAPLVTTRTPISTSLFDTTSWWFFQRLKRAAGKLNKAAHCWSTRSSSALAPLVTTRTPIRTSFFETTSWWFFQRLKRAAGKLNKAAHCWSTRSCSDLAPLVTTRTPISTSKNTQFSLFFQKTKFRTAENFYWTHQPSNIRAVYGLGADARHRMAFHCDSFHSAMCWK